MQTELEKSEYWEGKRLQEARESAMKNSIGLLDIAERLGLLKGKYKNLEDFFIDYNGVVNQMIDIILKNISLKTEFKKASEFKTEHVTGGDEDGEEKVQDGSITENQRRAVWAIIFGKDGNKSLADDLPCPIDELSFDFASSFIEKHGRKK